MSEMDRAHSAPGQAGRHYVMDRGGVLRTLLVFLPSAHSGQRGKPRPLQRGIPCLRRRLRRIIEPYHLIMSIKLDRIGICICRVA